MPYLSLTPGRAGGAVSHTFCWPKVAWRGRWLAPALRSTGRPTSTLLGSKPVFGDLCALGLAAPHSAAAQGTAILRSTVTDSLSGQPLAGVSGALVGPSGGMAPDAQEQFSLAGLTLSTYTLRAGTLGCKLENWPVTLAACVRPSQNRSSLRSRSDYKVHATP